jgi:4-hydroxybenzoate polyprenyltransferase
VAGTSWQAVVIAMMFSLITANIMVFNDLVEREHDRAKGKNLCYEHTWLVASTFVLSCAAISVLLLAVAVCGDYVVSLFASCVWLVGLSYSFEFVRKWYVTQNLIVAVCSASPILCGVVHTKTAPSSVLLTFCTLTTLVLLREFLKDVEDVATDIGYKETLPTRMGTPATFMTIILLVFGPTNFLLAISPIGSVRMAAYSMALVPAMAALALLHPERCRFVKYSVDLVLCCILLAVLIAP